MMCRSCPNRQTAVGDHSEAPERPKCHTLGFPGPYHLPLAQQQRVHTENSDIQEMSSSYEVDPVLEADIPHLSQHVGYLGIPREAKKTSKPPCRAGGQLPTNTQVLTWPWCTLRSAAHKHSQALTALAALLPPCLLVFLYLIICC